MADVATEFDVAVIGAGIVGAAIACHLSGRGLKVAVIDRTGAAAAASGASDGAVSVASKRPGALARLALESLAYTAELARPGGMLSGIFHLRPSYFFSTGEAESRALDALVEKLGALDGRVRVVADAPAQRLLPAIGAEAERIVEIAGEGHMLGYMAVHAYLASSTARPFWPARVVAFADRGDAVRLTLERPGGERREIVAGWLVVAAGVDSAQLLPDLPVQPRAGHLIVTDRAGSGLPPGLLTAATYLAQKTTGNLAEPRQPVVIDPLASGQYLIGSSREDHGDPARLDLDTIGALLRRAASVWPALSRQRVIRSFVGIRAATADGLPILGALPGRPRIIVATGFEGDGICLSALAGRTVAGWIMGDAATGVKLEADLAALSPARFCRREAVSA